MVEISGQDIASATIVVCIFLILRELLKFIVHSIESIPYKWPTFVISKLNQPALSCDLSQVGEAWKAKDAGLEIEPNAGQRLEWYDGKKEKAEYCLVAVHGWTASPKEYETVVDALAKHTHSNLLHVRLTGHGRVTELGEPLINEASPESLLQDVIDALLVARRLGQRILVFGSSTGAALLTWAIQQPDIRDDVHCAFFTSPAFSIPGFANQALCRGMLILRRVLPRSVCHLIGHRLIRMVIGEYKTPDRVLNEQHWRYWTLKYPSQGLYTALELISEVARLDPADIPCKCSFVGTHEDKTVPWAHTLSTVYPRLKHAKSILTLTPEQADHPHCVGADIVSPRCARLVAREFCHFFDTVLDSKYCS